MPDRFLLHELIDDQAARTPELTAVVFGERRLDYATLRARTNRLAQFLAGHGVGPEVVVGLCLDRGIDQLVGLLAIVQAGGAYLPLDPADPPERLRFMLRDAG